jgi:5-methylthioadenosine/S-adenosylhomocysteine deaminase
MNSATLPIPAELLLHPEWIIPIEPAGATLTNHALVIDAGKILDLLPFEQAIQRYRPQETINLPGQVLLPGLVNAHTHAAMTLLRGYADDMPLMDWLNKRIWPAENRHLSPDFVRTGTLLACAEMLRGGITTFNDMYFFPDAAIDAIRQAGMRAVVGLPVLEFPTPYATDADDYLRKGLAVRDANKNDPLLGFCLAPHAPYTVSDRSFEKVAMLAAQLETPIHLHVHETRTEVDESIRQYGVRPIERLHRLGLLGPQLIAVHAVHLTDAEIDLLGHHGCHIAHCPTSNLKLGSGIAPLTKLHARGINVGLGTDSAASNNRLDLFQEIRHAALLAKGASEDAGTFPAHAALTAATLGGARALGLDDQIGSLRPGKFADLCAVKLTDWLFQPCFDPLSHLVYAAGREQVTHTWVAGKLQHRDGIPLSIDISQLLTGIRLWHTRLADLPSVP